MIILTELESYRNLLIGNSAIFSAAQRRAISEHVEQPTRDLAEALAHKATLCLAAVVQLGGVIEDMQLTYRMISRYPWNGKTVSKAQHLELTWFLFQNLCYKFKEKMKLCFNSQKVVTESIAAQHPNWLSEEIKKIDSLFGREIRERGNTVHSWNSRNADLDLFLMVSTLNEIRGSGTDVDLPEGFLDVTGHYVDTKYLLKLRAKKLIGGAESAFIRIVNLHGPKPSELLSLVTKIVNDVNDGKVRLTKASGQENTCM